MRRAGSSTWTTVLQRASRTKTAFITETLDLAPYLRKTIQIGFFFETKYGSYDQFEGWYVDDVRVKCLNLRAGPLEGSADVVQQEVESSSETA